MSTDYLGILRVGDCDIALDCSELQEVVPLPGSLSPYPQASAWCRGTFSLRGVQMPIVDLALLLGLEPDQTREPTSQSIAIVGHRGGRIGLLIDRIHEVIAREMCQCHALGDHRKQPQGLVRSVFAHPADPARSVYRLDIEALLALDDLMLIFDGQSSRPELRSHAGTPNNRREALIVTAGAIRLALDVSVVREIVVCEALAEPAVPVPGYRGDHPLRGQTVPVVDIARLIGESGGPDRPEQLVVLDAGQGRLALGVQTIVGLADVTDAGCQPSLPHHHRAHGLVRGVLTLAAYGHVLLIDHQRLFEPDILGRLAQIHAAPAHDQPAASTGPWQRFAFLHFKAGGHWVTPIDQLHAVLARPNTMTPVNNASVFTGAFSYQNRAVALVDLRTLLGHPASQPAEHVLVVARDDTMIGLAVDRTQAIEYIEAPADSLRMRRRGMPRPDAALADQAKQLISIGVGDALQIRSVLDLSTLADLLIEPTSEASGWADVPVPGDSGENRDEDEIDRAVVSG